MLTDDAFAVFYNPAALGFSRRWSWAVGYTRWFADTYDATLVLHRQFRWLRSHKTFATVGLRYFGSPRWDSTEGADAAVSASHTVANLAIGQRLDWLGPSWLRRHLALGLGIRAVYSELATYNSVGVHANMGGVLRLGRFSLGPFGMGLFEYADVHLGGSLGNLVGRSTAFESQRPRLPRLWTGAASVRLAKHERWALCLTYQYCAEESGLLDRGLGGELIWNDLVSLRFGYRPDNSLGSWTFGLGLGASALRLGMPTLGGLGNSHLALDFAGSDYGPTLGWTERSTVAQYPAGPEPFALISPVEDGVIDGPNVHFGWEEAEDPDLGDEIRYLVLADVDRNKVIAAMRRAKTGDFQAPEIDSLLVHHWTDDPGLVSGLLPKGELYYWCVAAVDRTGHVRMGHGSSQIRKFRVVRPDLMVEPVELMPSRRLTGRNNPEQGELQVRIRNNGKANAPGFQLRLAWLCLDSCRVELSQVDSLLLSMSEEGLKRYHGDILVRQFRETVPAGGLRMYRFPWGTLVQGRYRVLAEVLPLSGDLMTEAESRNNRSFSTIFTIPKWADPEPFRIPERDRFTVSVIRYQSIAVPVVPMVFFAPRDTNVAGSYLHGEGVPAVLEVVADRMRENPDATLLLEGYVDPLSEPGAGRAVAEGRARQVKLQLVKLGVPERRIRISTAHDIFRRRIQRRPESEQDWLWITEENRRVEMGTSREFEKLLFGPMDLKVLPTIIERDPRTQVPAFDLRIHSCLPLRTWRLRLRQSNEDLFEMQGAVPEDVQRGLLRRAYWDGRCLSGSPPPVDVPILCRVTVEDSLGRVFATEEQPFSLSEVSAMVREEIFALFDFDTTSVPFSFYLEQLEPIAQHMISSPELRIRFEGHADAIGSVDYNLALSRDRAWEITEAFKRVIRERHSGFLSSILDRIDTPRWFGEGVPLVINVAGQREMLLGNNDDAIGRNRNRRVMILIYRISSSTP
ncbi:MAG: hypothetical protein ONB23_04025 [candidate division KSB1 bacterium]|nr:hypothetical protein [candidate division KSB1 bacterium]